MHGLDSTSNQLQTPTCIEAEMWKASISHFGLKGFECHINYVLKVVRATRCIFVLLYAVIQVMTVVHRR